MTSIKDNHRKAAKEQYKKDKAFVALHNAVTKFHQDAIEEYGKVFLVKNLDFYRRSLIRFTRLYSRKFSKLIEISRTTMLIVSLLNELETE